MDYKKKSMDIYNEIQKVGSMLNNCGWDDINSAYYIGLENRLKDLQREFRNCIKKVRETMEDKK